MATSTTDRIEAVASLLGFTSSLTEDDVPKRSQVKAWLLDGQRYLASVLPVDAMPELWRTQSTSVSTVIPEGARIVSVTLNGVTAIHTPITLWNKANDPGSLWEGTAEQPRWTTKPKSTSMSGTGVPQEQEILVAPAGSSGEIVYLDPAGTVTPSEEIMVGPQMWPALEAYAFFKAKQADEDDQGAQVALGMLRDALSGLGVVGLGRQGIVESRPHEDGS